MDNKKKRSFEAMEPPSSPAEAENYVFSESELKLLKKSAKKHPSFTTHLQNRDLNTDTKIAALKASPSIVSLISFSGGEVMFHTSGTIIETDYYNNNVVITSLNLLRKRTTPLLCRQHTDNDLIDHPKIIVNSSDGLSYIGKVEAFDHHYNLLILNFKSKNSLPPACLRLMEDEFNFDKSFELRPHSVKVKNGDPLIAVGRYFYDDYKVMAAPGTFSMERCESFYQCRELLSSDCNITRCGDGAPLVNLSGEVLAIGYYVLGRFTPLLPINIAHKWWIHYKTHKEMRHPSYGFEATNMYSATLSDIEMTKRKFLSISNGVRVDEVLPGSNAESAGLCEGDIILKCDDKIVKGFFQLWGLMWDKVGDVVELEVARINLSRVEGISMLVSEAVPNKLNMWPRYDYD